MRLVLLSGGSGKRLWPLSNDSRSKQFLKVLKNSEDEMVSMVQRVWRQLEKNDLASKSVIATSIAQVDMINSQLGAGVPIVTEPERRDTFPAIALAATYLYSVQNTDLNEVVGMLPVDPYVEERFFNRVKDLETALLDSKADLALMGVTPTFPSEKYGYIVPSENESDNFLIVDHFKEKPERSNAEELIEKNALWNCGVFAFKLKYIINLLNDKGLPTDYKELLINYNLLPENSFDFEVVEKTENIVALPYDGSWKDLGTWNTLTEEMASNITGKGLISESTINSHIVNELDIPITLLGIDNAIVAASPDGILVADKESSPKVKEYVSNMQGRPMYEERRWGWYRVLEHIKYQEGNEVLTKRLGINAGKNLSYQMHYKRSEVWTIIKGEGIFALNDQLNHVRSGDVIHIPLAAKHALKATTDMELIEVQTGSELIEEDIYRTTTSWEEIENSCKINT
ncbi:mannose-1-phosphate guanylyltransferase [Thalassobacillus devorans]|uniref:Mannose-1-phosphate guanylyltransferase n=1 Tax=Thalassobacillus devorans TaxID=279813 RepID=A0ABQ1NTG0_9BACI|nr:sugar phosphate nucleotidyltransferase [Thalassobacillus devorans]NIK28608.1 mannose-1-phosphate guanylyltransferase [Thalassobacillus devorans]GGC84911.1 mannose-1-phosphate guanylyltransferase [Thalassobacillus devorans]